MNTDSYSRQILTENDLCEIYLKDPEHVIKHATVDKVIKFSDYLEIENIPKLDVIQPLSFTIEEYDLINQENWYIPASYKIFDIAQWVLEQCKEDYELQRVGEELLLYQERDLFPLLRYCKYLVDTMKEHNVVWGVGRGSSVASYVLYLIGVHRINSLHYDLSIDEFLK
jgi:DNA polymerase III alpha subunit